MKHSIREHIVDPIRGKVVKISTINAELGSGITDKNGKEIFEGDIVKVTNERGDRTGGVIFNNGQFGVDGQQIYSLLNGLYGELEVIGHVDD